MSCRYVTDVVAQRDDAGGEDGGKSERHKQVHRFNYLCSEFYEKQT